MNFSTQKLKKIFALRRRDRDPSKLEPDPYRDWKIILSLFCAGLIIVAAFDAHVFFSLQQEVIPEESTTATSTSLSRKSLEDALMLYEGKEKNFDALQNSRTDAYTEVPDPSR